jgi:dihydrofolate reductase
MSDTNKMKKRFNSVYIATSLDGYIADADNGIAFLDTYPIPEGTDMGYDAFMSNIDALLMGRKTFETVLGFGIEWPYQKPVFVWSHTLYTVPKDLETKVQLVSGDTQEVLQAIHEKGYERLYIDGGKVIQSLLKENLIDEMIITTIPVILGTGISLFGETNGILKFKCIQSKVFENGLSQNVYISKRKVEC